MAVRHQYPAKIAAVLIFAPTDSTRRYGKGAGSGTTSLIYLQKGWPKLASASLAEQVALG